ncbi:acyl--CoA ligase [Aestuariicella sp. G3-2]|uniref:class I adenylate-forming enzyme family protein n=1 Tax=Pseudomaricurvus albidus TaxID=2842452 RepID=UPI001C0B1C5E|nr:class I adenylate-forming enzyme family protein [Aestuariicella albida]MBU3069523.1 acyl--CoA ligase [Aestuariicella albida]
MAESSVSATSVDNGVDAEDCGGSAEVKLAAAIGEGWPAVSLDACQEQLCAAGERFEMEIQNIRGVSLRVWKNVPDSLAALAEIGREHGDRLFTIYEDERVTYEAWYRAVAQLAHKLDVAGVKRGDRVALAMGNLPEWPVVFFAAASLGAIVVPLNAWWMPAELTYALSDSGASVLVCDSERFQRLKDVCADLPELQSVVVSRWQEELPEGVLRLEDWIGSPADYHSLPVLSLPSVDLCPEDEATIFYTSGTTGKPKGAVGTHRNCLTNILSGAYSTARAAVRRGEEVPEPEPKVSLVVIPLFHVTACNAAMMGTIFYGHTMIFMPGWDPVKAFGIIEREKVNSTGGVPTIAWQLLEHPERHKFDLSSIEAVSYGGAPAAPDLVLRIHEEFGALPATGWGMTETSATVTLLSSEEYLNRPSSCGPAVPVADIKIMDLEGVNEMPLGEVGELWAKGPQVVKEYWGNPEESRKTFVDGWVRTGDLAKLDEEGFCYIVGRAKELVIRGGENIYPSEVENVLYDHPAVTDAALVGIPHRTLGEEPAAVVHLAPGSEVTEEELKLWVRERLAIFKTPVKILFSDTILPRNANGKILKLQLKTWFEGLD